MAITAAFDAEYEPSPWEPIAEEVELYERTAGAEPSALVGDQVIEARGDAPADLVRADDIERG